MTFPADSYALTSNPLVFLVAEMRSFLHVLPPEKLRGVSQTWEQARRDRELR